MPVTIAVAAPPDVDDDDDNCSTATNKYQVIHKRVYLCPCGFCNIFFLQFVVFILNK